MAPANGDSQPLSERTGLGGADAARSGAIGLNVASGCPAIPGGVRLARVLGRGGVTNACSDGLCLFTEGCTALD